MSAYQTKSSQAAALQRTTNGLNYPQYATNFEAYGHNMYQSAPAENDAQIAARRAMTKRSSRSFAARISRTRSRKMEVVGKSVKPGITVDTSFTKYKGNVPHQMYPQEGETKSSGGSTKKPGWFALARSGTKAKGLGITKGTPQPEVASGIDPKTADSLVSEGKSWQEISPWDRPIPIGISVPSDSVTDFSPYLNARKRSDSDATLATPSIIITPADAMKSVWSPDTDSDYTPARGTFRQTDNSGIPPVPALPTGVATLPYEKRGYEAHRGAADPFSSRTRSDTLDSNVTAFEEEDDVKRKDRIMSTGTVFEEDNTPLRDNAHSTLAVDSATTPNARRSQGWWNVITTPFVMSRSNSLWTQHGPRASRNPDIPMMPTETRVRTESPSTPSTYIWSATEKSPSDETQQFAPAPRTKTDNTNVASPQSAMSASPVVGTAAIGTILMPRQVEQPPEPQAVPINIKLQERWRQAPSHDITANAPPKKLTIQIPCSNTNRSPLKDQKTQQAVPTFPPPPTYIPKGKGSRASSPVTTTGWKKTKKHRKAGNMMTKLALCRRKKDEKKQDKKKKRSRCLLCCGCCLIILILLAIIIPIVVVFTKKHNNSDPMTPSQWLNLTGYPPIPTGVSTIAQPEAVKEQTGCVEPATAWSCAVPKEQYKDISPNKADQPNLKLEILFQNGTVADVSKTRPLRRGVNAVSAGAFVRHLNARAAPSASPAPPSVDDRKFLGQTTDKVSAPFEGEDTPFFISIQDAKASPSSRFRLLKRDGSDDPNNITGSIPPPALNADGTAAPAELFPYPSAQPLRLFNRGKAEEHYGFYTYFDRAIFLKSIEDSFGRGGNPADTDGGSTRDAARLRCTYSQTRFLVQIWTRSQTTKPLLHSSVSNSSEATLARPGTFPYPVTVTLDRHGGDASKKNLYCYNMENDTTIINETKNKFLVAEDRAFGGILANGTNGLTNITTPIDGGSGGCGCTWQNWLA
ncbi:hypothetical protein P280DRAFT_460356 [Massarina eburnea CBS 473.64]|uniref:Glycoprotease family protein n=1 Tax=Massarina eburnea CBS 473.64 TaxID=1395130 RepID=A0A6A6RNK1_9PLEO|nr:hypothetical protein P280DRAFT_460356 [Massarina eburnea CBS 473.64]